MKIALVTDTHFGLRGDSRLFSDFIGRFYSEVFFPYLDKHNIRTVRHLGDVMDRRKYINYLTARNFRDQFINPCEEREIDLGIIIGNHDVFFKDTNEINSMQELLKDNSNIKWWSKPVTETFGKTKIVMMPWICADNYDESMELIENTDALCLFGHLEVAGFSMYKGVQAEDGISPSVFDKFDVVCSGHFHHKSTMGNIHYLGAPYEMTWSDYDDPRGFHIFDTETLELEYIENPLHMFHKIGYSDQDKTLPDLLAEFDLSYLKDSYVKLVVREKNNPYWFDMVVDRLEKLGLADLKIVEDKLNLNIDDIDDIVDEAEDTLTIIKKYAATFLQDKDAVLLGALNTLLGELYMQAQNMDVTA